ncbi:MAG: cytochrome d terminal oxidase subunit 1 [Methylomonas sp.]|nr:MAG: cytochrome d terminal oxidase subunit 1 [Methylomonas sp.]
MISETVVELSRWQFAITAMLHFLCIPLTLGLALLLALIESVFVATGHQVYKTMAQFWGRVFVISFLLAVATRLLVIGQFGMNGAYFSHYVGEVFALPLAIEALTGFFLAAVLLGPYWFGWGKLGKTQHLLITWLIALAVNVSAYWVLMANGWLQNPLAATFNYQSYRLELTDLNQFFGNPAGIGKYVHATAASYVTGAATLMAVSGYWLRKKPADVMARQSFSLSATLGLIALIVVVWLGDATPQIVQPVQQVKLAAIQGEVGSALLPDIESRVRSGMKAFGILEGLRDDQHDPGLLAEFEQYKANLGYGLLLTPFHKTILGATDQQISQAAQSALPAYPWLICWSYRIMIAAGVLNLIWFALAVFKTYTAPLLSNWLLTASIYSAPLPWLACILGWFVSEAGKQPWAIAGVLPTFLSVSSLSVKELLMSVVGYGFAYAVLFGGGGYLMRQAIIGHNANDQGA